MKKKVFMLCFLTAVCLFHLFESIGQSIHLEFTNYISISNGEFKDGDNVFKPLFINYVVNYAKNLNTGEYYIAPHFNYSEDYWNQQETEINDSVYPYGHFGYGPSGSSEMNAAKAKLDHDLKVIDSLGFNVVRIPPAIYWRNNMLKIPTGTYSKYFELTDTLIAKCARHNLRVILVLEADTHAFKHFDQYCIYLDSVSRHYSNNKAVMAYVVFAEPGYKWKKNSGNNNDKLMISNWSRKWYYLIKKNAPNQLVTYGLDGVNNVLFWDPSALTYDFLSMHFYYNSSNPDSSKVAVGCYLKWMHDNVEDVWVLGETGFSGTNDTCKAYPYVGSDTAQYRYADYTIQRALNCGCRGYSWWQYQEVMRGNCRSNHYGIVKYAPSTELKMVHSLFPEYSSREPMFRCIRPNCYYNIPGYNYSNISGVVKDEYSNPIRDAVVKTWSDTYKTSYTTYTNSHGEYTIYTPQDTSIGLVWISHKGYTDTYFFNNNNSFETTTLTHINFNRWKKNWTNRNYPVTGNTPEIKNSDTIVVGNFCGDDAQELVVIHYSSGTATLYKFHTDHWVQRWTGSFDDWQIISGDKFYAGDYNGDGYDELLCVRNASNSLASIYHYNSNPHYFNHPWQSVWTNSGNGQIGDWNYTPGDIILTGRFNDSTYCSLLFIRKTPRPAAQCLRLASNSWVTVWRLTPHFIPPPVPEESLTNYNKYYVGDFNGDGIDELLCTQVTNGTSDLMNLLRLDSIWTSLWTNNGIGDGVEIYPYRDHLHVGNFDADRADEILGISSWATKFDLNSINQWNQSWSTNDSGRLSDWIVNPNHRIFFMKVMTDVPDYLFVSRWINVSFIFPDIYLFDAYSYDP